MTKKAIVLSFLGMLSMPFTASAGLITGVLNISGTAVISLGEITFLNNSYLINPPSAAQGGGFGVLAGTNGTIQNITNPPDATGPLNVPLFMTFNAAPNLSITLTFLMPGIDGAAGCSATPAATGQQCTPVVPNQSPYNLQNTSATSSTASFNILGTEVDTITGNSIALTGAFSTQFSNMNYQQVLAIIYGTGGSPGPGTVTTSFAANLTTSPEPSTWIGLSLGLGAIGVCAYRRKFIKA